MIYKIRIFNASVTRVIRNIKALIKKDFCISITFNNPLKVCFSNKKNTVTTQTRPTQIVKVYFLLKNRVLTDF